MRKLFIFFLLVSSLLANTTSIKYKVTFGIFGKIGLAKADVHIDGEKYNIKIHAKSTGMANFLSGEREEWYQSSGTVDKNGILIPDFYQKTVQRYSSSMGETVLKKETKKYLFSHDTKELHVDKVKFEDGKQINSSREAGDYYAQNDLLSLFFNFKVMLPDLEIKSTSQFHAVGVNKTDGLIEVTPVENIEKVKKQFKKRDGHIMNVIIKEDIFSDKEDGKLLVNLRNDGICQEALLKSVMIFGDIKGIIIEES